MALAVWPVAPIEPTPARLPQTLSLSQEDLHLAQQGLLYPGLQEQWQLLRPGPSNHRHDLERIRKELVRIGRIPKGTPLPALDASFVFSPLPPPVVEPAAAAGPPRSRSVGRGRSHRCQSGQETQAPRNGKPPPAGATPATR
jgi:hypothetical protein